MGKCPVCKKEISHLNRIYTVIATDEIIWNGEDLYVENVDLEEEDDTLVLCCPVCGRIIGYSLDDAEDILKGQKNE